MKERVQIWMSLESFRTLKAKLESLSDPLGEFADVGGPLEELLVAMEEAQCNNANHEPV